MAIIFPEGMRIEFHIFAYDDDVGEKDLEDLHMFEEYLFCIEEIVFVNSIVVYQLRSQLHPSYTIFWFRS